MSEQWRGRIQTAGAMALICRARILIALVPLGHWRRTLGWDGPAQLSESKRLAKLVEWAARRLPIESKCLPRAMALSWLLRRKHLGHTVVFAVRPPEARGAGDGLHAWVEVGGEIVLGNLAGPWVETLRIG